MQILYMMRQKKLLKLFFACGCIWIIIVLYFYTSLDLAVESVWHSIVNRALDRGRLKQLMAFPVQAKNVEPKDPLEQIVLIEEGMLNFYQLPIRKLDTTYTELTTANRETSQPLAPDFTFHLNYSEKEVTLYEDYGPGCVFRIYLMPSMPTETSKLHKLTSDDLRKDFICLEIDARNFWFSIQQMMDGTEWPFLHPVNTQHPKPASGIGAYTPFCYEKKIKIIYQPSKPLPKDLFEKTVHCSLHELTCPVKIYSAVSRHKYPYGTEVSSFANINMGRYGQAHHTNMMEGALNLLSQPEHNGPDSGQRCQLTCVELCKDCQRTIFEQRFHGVISALKFRVFETATSHVLADWSNIFITMHWDNTAVPQVNKIPLGALFGAQGSLNDFKGAALGRRQKTCSYGDQPLKLPRFSHTGYIYFPMPFWRNAKVVIEGSESIDTSLLVCYQVTTVPNFYDPETTAYFHAHRSYYGASVDGWRDILSLSNSWGHIVGLLMDTDNLKANRNAPLSERWAALQSDAVLYIDDSQSASMLGTGLEDYFSYGHGFSLAENSSYSFVGVYHVGPHKVEPLTWYCYRLHILDPIPFSRNIKFIMEGTGKEFTKPEKEISFKEYMDKRKSERTALSHLVLYYAKDIAGSTPTDKFILGDQASEAAHSFSIISSSESTGSLFNYKRVSFLGNVVSNTSYAKTGRVFNANDKFTFKLEILAANKGIRLRREFHTELVEKGKDFASASGIWNQKAHVMIDGQDVGFWFIPLGTLSKEYSLRHDDFMIPSKITFRKTSLQITIKALSHWRDISYEAIVIQ